MIVRKPETIEALSRAAFSNIHNQSWVKKANLIIVVCADLRPYRRVSYRERGENLFVLQETAAAIQNLLLTACALDLGACWVGLTDEEIISESLMVPKGIRPVAIIPIGHTKSKTRPTSKKPQADVVTDENF